MIASSVSYESMFYKVNANKTFVDIYDKDNPHSSGYARPLQQDARFRVIKTTFNWKSFTPVILSDRSHRDSTVERYAVLDGQRRIAVAQQLFGSEVELDCIVYLGLSQQEEARIYGEINNNRTPLTSIDRYRGKLAEKDDLHVNLQRLLDSHRLEIGKNITAVSQLLRMYERSPEICSETLRILRYAWHKRNHQFHRHSMSSVYHFLMLVPEHILSKDRLIKKMQDNSPRELMEMIGLHKRLNSGPSAYGSNTAGAEVLKKWYNSHLKDSTKLIRNDFVALHRYSETMRLQNKANANLDIQ